VPKYAYVATDLSGTTIKGTLDAASAVRARNDLLGRELNVLEVKQRKSFTQIEITPKKVKPQDLMLFSRQMGAFLRAGIPILDALEMLIEDASNAQLKQVLVEVSDDLRAGRTFADAMARHRDAFPSYYLGILRSAELSGNLDTVLDQLAKYIERDLEASRTIKSALTYPLVVLFMAIATVVLLISYVLPRFKDFFDDFDATLPLPTRILLAIGDFFSNWGLVFLAVVVVAIVLLYMYGRTSAGKRTRDASLLRLPLIRDIVRFSVAERYCRILGAMLRAGVPVPEASTSAIEATNNRVFAEKLSIARDATLRGEGISRPVADTELFPLPVEKMLLVGEESGTLDQQLDAAAIYCEGERQYRLKRLTTLFEPAVIVVMGFIVGFVAIAMVSALYGIYDQVNFK
jgi:type IV pilus assembly protein PilC